MFLLLLFFIYLTEKGMSNGRLFAVSDVSTQTASSHNNVSSTYATDLQISLQKFESTVLDVTASSLNKTSTKKNSAAKAVRNQTSQTGDVDYIPYHGSEKTKQLNHPEVLLDFPYVVPFVYKNRFPAATVSSGVIVTELLILSAAYPIAILPRNMFCALPGFPHLTNATITDIQNNCIDFKNIILESNWTASKTSLNLAVIEVVRPISFTWYVSTAPIMYTEKPEQMQFEEECTLAGWLYRPAINAPGLPLPKIATEFTYHKVIRKPKPGMYHGIVAVGPAMDFCTAHVGMPIICSCQMIGLMALDDMKGDIPCTRAITHSYLYLFSPKAHQFLSRLVPDTPKYAEDHSKHRIYNEDRYTLHPVGRIYY